MSFIQKLSSYIIVVSIVSVFAFFPIYFSSCEQSFVNPETSTFPPEIESLFNTPYNASNNTCASVACHNSESRAGGLDLVNWSNAMNGSSQGTMIVPYNGFWSHLIFVVNSDTNFAPVVDLLPSIHKMPADKVSQLKTWIDNGAANKNGEVAFNSISNPCFITNQASDIMAVVDPSRKLVTRLFSVGGRTQTLLSVAELKLLTLRIMLLQIMQDKVFSFLLFRKDISKNIMLIHTSKQAVNPSVSILLILLLIMLINSGMYLISTLPVQKGVLKNLTLIIWL